MIVWISSSISLSAPCVFLDRDGILNQDRSDYIKNRREFVFYADALVALRQLKKLGVQVVIVSNQSALHRGLLDWNDFFDIHHYMIHEVHRAGGWIHAAFYCPHRPEENCSCRKPQPDMLLMASSLFSISRPETAFVGDRLSDVVAAEKAGCIPVLVHRSLDPLDAPNHVPVYTSLLDFVEKWF